MGSRSRNGVVGQISSVGSVVALHMGVGGRGRLVGYQEWQL